MLLRLTVLLLTFVAGTQACSPHRSIDRNPTTVRQAIDRENAAFIDGMARADAAAVAARYDEHATHLDDIKVVQGRDAIAADVAHFLHEVGPVKVTVETARVWVAETVAYESGRWTYTITPAGAGEHTIGGRYVTVWKPQTDGSWKIMADLSVPGTELRQ